MSELMNKKKVGHGKQISAADMQQLFSIAVEHQQAGRLDEAEVSCQQLLDQNPREPMALCLMGTVSRMKGNAAKSIRLFQQVLEVSPDFVPALGNLGDIHHKAGSYQEALFYYGKVAQVDPANLMAYFNMGLVYSVLAQPEDAIAQFTKALAIHPNLASAHSNIGAAMMELGHIDEAITSFEKALSIDPSLADAHHNMHAAVFDENNTSPAIASLQAALEADPASHDSRAYLGMCLDISGDKKSAEEHFSYIEQNVPQVYDKVDSWRYVASHLTPDVRLFSITRYALEYAFSKAELDGLILEFGVRNGVSTNILARLTDQDIHGFDSFEGLPEQWEGMPVGALSTFNELPDVPGHVHLHAGWFEDTLSGFVAEHPGPIKFMNIDCDIYSSTKTIFDNFEDRIIPGTVIIFDEYISNPAWRDHEYKAFQEFIKKTGLDYEYLLFSPYSKQAAVRITS